jgi:hypothetical protein
MLWAKEDPKSGAPPRAVFSQIQNGLQTSKWSFHTTQMVSTQISAKSCHDPISEIAKEQNSKRAKAQKL